MSETPWQTVVHDKILVPLLPPPILHGMQKLDPLLDPYVGGPNSSITVASTVILAWIFVWLLFRLTSTNGGTAVVDEAEQRLAAQLRNNQDTITTTVLLTGSRKSGKTRLFCYLAHHHYQTVTVMSIQSNVCVQEGLRFLDWPGCRPLVDASGDNNATAATMMMTDILHHSLLRIVVMVDATQPARAAAESLWQLWPQLAVRQQQRRHRRRGGGAAAATQVLVACHKQDLPKARNEKRLRIQLRNELERLRVKEEPTWWPAEVATYEDLGFCNLTFRPTTLETLKGAKELAAWCRTGSFVEKGGSATTNGTS